MLLLINTITIEGASLACVLGALAIFYAVSVIIKAYLGWENPIVHTGPKIISLIVLSYILLILPTT